MNYRHEQRICLLPVDGISMFGTAYCREDHESLCAREGGTDIYTTADRSVPRVHKEENLMRTPSKAIQNACEEIVKRLKVYLHKSSIISLQKGQVELL